MAQPVQRENFTEREKYGEGHDMKWELSVSNLLDLRSWPIEKTYQTFCETSPTTWRFKMWFPEIRNDGSGTMTVTLERTDSTHLELEACVWIDICDSNENLIYPKQTFEKNGMLPGDLLQQTVKITPRPNMSDAVRRDAIILVTLMISFCHSDSE